MVTLTRFQTADELFYAALDHTISGEVARPRGMECYERRGVTLTLLDPSRNIITHKLRTLNYHFMVAEWLWMLFGLEDVKTIAGYNKQIAQFSDDGEKFFGAYGPRFRRDIVNVVELLRRDLDSRQAILCTWRPEALTRATKDVPCTLTWQFFVRRGTLELHVNMRSNDVWLGLPYDLFNFTQIQRHIAALLDVDVGQYVHHVGSLHLYEKNLDQANSVLKNGWLVNDVGATPAPPGWLDDHLRYILEGLPRSMTPATARHLQQQLLGNWKSFAGVLTHRFSKDRTDLDGFWQQVIP